MCQSELMRPLTFPVVTIFGHEEVVAHFACGHTFNHVTGLQWIHDHAVDFLFASIHFHFAFVGKQLPSVAAFAQPLTRIVQLLGANAVNLWPQAMCLRHRTRTEIVVSDSIFSRLVDRLIFQCRTWCADLWLRSMKKPNKESDYYFVFGQFFEFEKKCNTL